MKKIVNTIVENSLSLKIFSNTNLLLTLVFLYKKEGSTSPKEISEFFKADLNDINKHLLILEKKGLINKITKLDKSKNPPFLNTFYKINIKKYEKMLDDVKKIVDSCLNETN